MQILNDISNLLTVFQTSFIYHQVTILAYKILIKNICVINIPYGTYIDFRIKLQKRFNTSWYVTVKQNMWFSPFVMLFSQDVPYL